MGQLQNLLTKISEAASFLGPEIQAIPDEKFANFWRTRRWPRGKQP